MKIGIPKEITVGETRVAVIPAMISVFTKDEHEVLVQSGAGDEASFFDSEYESAGATVVKGAAELYGESDIVIKFQAPIENTDLGKHEIDLMKDAAILVSSLPPRTHAELIPKLLKRNITTFAMEYLPRITKAQSMDVLSSMSTVAGYKAVLVAAYHLGKFFPLLMTAAGTIPPVTALILGAGVAGLQAIATAKRLGAKVEAFDPRPVVQEQIESLGARFIAMPMQEDVETSGGYAKAQSDAFLKQEQEVIAARLPNVDAVVTTAQIFGKPAPVLITEEMVKLMHPGSVIVDLAVADGGNCELARPGETVEKYGVTIFGAANIASSLPVHASQMHSKNLATLFKYIFTSSDDGIDYDDEIVKGMLITRNGEVVNDMVKQTLK